MFSIDIALRCSVRNAHNLFYRNSTPLECSTFRWVPLIRDSQKTKKDLITQDIIDRTCPNFSKINTKSSKKRHNFSNYRYEATCCLNLARKTLANLLKLTYYYTLHISNFRYVQNVDKRLGMIPHLGLVSGVVCDSPHGIWIDSKGDTYVSEVIAENRLQKFVRV